MGLETCTTHHSQELITLNSKQLTLGRKLQKVISFMAEKYQKIAEEEQAHSRAGYYSIVYTFISILHVIFRSRKFTRQNTNASSTG